METSGSVTHSLVDVDLHHVDGMYHVSYEGAIVPILFVKLLIVVVFMVNQAYYVSLAQIYYFHFL